jgi:ribosomal protein L11 methylase PrmA
VLANLLAPLLATWAAHMQEGAPRPDAIVASGLLTTEAESVAGLFTALGYGLLHRLEHAEWAALVLARRES